MDGGIRPSQLNPYAQPLSSEAGVFAAAMSNAKRPSIEQLRRSQRNKALAKEKGVAQDDLPDDEEALWISEDEQAELLAYAKLRGIMNLAFHEGHKFRFQWDDDLAKVVLVQEPEGTILLVMDPEDLQELSERMHRYAGMLTNFSV